MPPRDPPQDRDRDRDATPSDHAGVLADPTHADTYELLRALDTLDAEAARAWLADHPEAAAQLEAEFEDVFEALKDVFDALPAEATRRLTGEGGDSDG